MKLALTILLIVANCIGQEYLPNRRMAFKVTSTAASCPADGSPDQLNNGGSDNTLGDTTGRTYCGVRWTNASPITICKLGFELKKAAGTLVGKTFYAQIFAMTGNTLDANALGIASVVGSDWASEAFVRFSFGTPVVLQANTPYAFVLSCAATANYPVMAEVDAVNYAYIYSSTTDNIPNCSRCTWNTDKTQYQNYAASEPSIEIYFYD